MVRRAIEAQGGPSEAAGRSAALGPGATLADTGEQTLALLDSMASQPGATATQAGRQLARRSRRQIDELTEAIGEGRAAEAIEASKRFRSEQASPLYEQAFAEGVPHTDTLEELFSRPAVVRAWQAAKRRGQNISGIDPDAYGSTRPSLEGWQAVKESLDDQVSALRRAGRDKQAIEIEQNILDPLLAELDEASPLYREARQMWAGSKAFDDAIEKGRRFVREPSAVATGTLEALGDAEREAYKIGAVQAIQDMLESQGWTHDATKRFRTPRMERKLKALLGSEEYADFANRLEASRVKQATFGRVGKGSDTARREAFRADQAMAQALADFGADVVSTGSATLPFFTRAAQGVRQLGQAPESARNLAGGMLLDEDVLRAIRAAYAPAPPIVTQGAGLLPALAAPIAAPAAAGLLPPRER